MNENNLNQENQNNNQQAAAVGMVPTNNEQGVVTSTPLTEPVVNPTPINNTVQPNVTNEPNINQNSLITGNNANNEKPKNSL